MSVILLDVEPAGKVHRARPERNYSHACDVAHCACIYLISYNLMCALQTLTILVLGGEENTL